MENLLEYQTLSMFGTYSIAFALRAIGSVLAIWLGLRATVAHVVLCWVGPRVAPH